MLNRIKSALGLKSATAVLTASPDVAQTIGSRRGGSKASLVKLLPFLAVLPGGAVGCEGGDGYQGECAGNDACSAAVDLIKENPDLRIDGDAEDMAEGGVTGDMAEGGVTGDMAEGGVPGDMAEGGVPGDMAEGGVPGDMAEGGVPADMAEGGVPGDMAEGGVPADMAEGGVPADMAEGPDMAEGRDMVKPPKNLELFYNMLNTPNYWAGVFTNKAELSENTGFSKTQTGVYATNLDAMKDQSAILRLSDPDTNNLAPVHTTIQGLSFRRKCFSGNVAPIDKPKVLEDLLQILKDPDAPFMPTPKGGNVFEMSLVCPQKQFAAYLASTPASLTKVDVKVIPSPVDQQVRSYWACRIRQGKCVESTPLGKWLTQGSTFQVAMDEQLFMVGFDYDPIAVVNGTPNEVYVDTGAYPKPGFDRKCTSITQPPASLDEGSNLYSMGEAWGPYTPQNPEPPPVEQFIQKCLGEKAAGYRLR